MPFAHSANADGNPQDLADHLRRVAELTAEFATPFGGRELGYFAGLWHDVGKYDPAWQTYLQSVAKNPSLRGTGPDHKAAGATLADRHGCPFVGMLIQGHHGGLTSPSELTQWLNERRKATPAVLDQAIAAAHQHVADLDPAARLELPDFVAKGGTAAELWFRMLFSALVDADYLDTEQHFNKALAGLRDSDVGLATLRANLNAHRRGFTSLPVSTVNAVRQKVHEDCLTAAALPSGFFELNVPTGGGKTLSSMGFALEHARQHGHRRVVVAVPYISITEQTAEVYRHAFGPVSDNAVLEHHSGVTLAEGAMEDFRAQAVWSRLAAENWDAPVVVTTVVQLFESLFNNTTSKTRRLHRLAKSVIILDEAQALPAHLLEPILDALRGLTERYGTTVVISTATQPAFESISGFEHLKAAPIVQQPKEHFTALRRVIYDWRIDAPMDWPKVAALLRTQRQALAIVNTKRQALSLLDALGGQGLHLSTLLCGAHRRYVIGEVKRRLAEKESCILVATQVIEAGVDVDFPLVLRVLAPLDSIIQAAGRCNREGRLPEPGKVIIFLPPGSATELTPPGPYRTATDVTRVLRGAGPLDADDPASARAYFRLLFQTVATDRDGIQKLRARLNYPEVAHRFRMIDDETESVVIDPKHVPGLDNPIAAQRSVDQTLRELQQGSSNGRLLLRRLQPYVVNVRRREAQGYKQRGLIAPVTESLGRWLGQYDPIRGLVAAGMDPAQLVV